MENTAEKRRLTKEEIREIAERFLANKVWDIIDDMDNANKLIEIAKKIEDFVDWYEKVSEYPYIEYAYISLQAEEWIERLEELISEHKDIEDYIPEIVSTLEEKIKSYLKFYIVGVEYHKGDLYLVIDSGVLAQQMNQYPENIASIFIMENKKWFNELLNGEYYDESEVKEEIAYFFEDNDEAYERLEELVKMTCDFDDFVEKLDKVLSLVNEYMEEFCKDMEDEEDMEEEPNR